MILRLQSKWTHGTHFLSYSRSDYDDVHKYIAPFLRSKYGRNAVFIDTDLGGGIEWWKEILHQINSCDVFVYLVSNKSLGSPYCQAEFREAVRLRKRFLPLVIQPSEPDYNHLPYDLAKLLKNTQYINISRWNTRFDQFAIRITDDLDNLIHLAQKTAPVPPLSLVSTPKPELTDSRIGRLYKSVAMRWFIGLVTAVIVSLISGILLAALIQADRFDPTRNGGQTSVTPLTTIVSQNLTQISNGEVTTPGLFTTTLITLAPTSAMSLLENTPSPLSTATAAPTDTPTAAHNNNYNGTISVSNPIESFNYSDTSLEISWSSLPLKSDESYYVQVTTDNDLGSNCCNRKFLCAVARVPADQTSTVINFFLLTGTQHE